MKTEFVFLQRFEDDLREAAAREASALEGSTSVATHDLETRAAPSEAPPSGRPGSRRLPRREHRWTALVAAGVSLLVIAGGIGFVAQNRTADQRLASAPGIAAGASATPASGFGLPTTSGGSKGSVDQRAGALAGDTPAHAPAANPLPAASGNGTSGASYEAASIAGIPQTDLSKIVRDGSVGLEVGNGTFGKSVAALTRIAVANHGMILSSATKNETSGVFTLRIPASRFDEAMLQLRGIAKITDGRVLYDTRTGQDVTAQFVDLQARLTLLKQRRALLVSLQNKATTVAGILAIANKVDQVQLQIEQIQGQLNLINDQVAESTIKASIREKDAANTTTPRPSQSRLGSAWHTAVDGFVNVVSAVIVGLGYLIPIGVLALLGWLVFTLARRKRHAPS